MHAKLKILSFNCQLKNVIRFLIDKWLNKTPAE